MDEAQLIEKLCKIEALFADASSAGEKTAAGRARERILQRIKEIERADPAIEYRFSMPDMWRRRVFVALLRRYGIRPFRYRRQRFTTVMARASKSFVDGTLWPRSPHGSCRRSSTATARRPRSWTSPGSFPPADRRESRSSLGLPARQRGAGAAMAASARGARPSLLCTQSWTPSIRLGGTARSRATEEEGEGMQGGGVWRR